MRSKIAFLALMLVSSAYATEVIFDDYDVTLTKQGGASWGTTFLGVQLGSFQSGFTPTADNLSSWGANFQTVGTPGYYDPSGPEWSTSMVLKDNTAPFAVGTQLFLWAFDSKTVGGGSQWLLLTDSSWKLGTMDAAIPSQDLNFTNGTTAALGLGAFDYSTLSASTFTTAVPEPSTYAAILGFVTLGLVGYRRFRRR
jgi:hypothetical protein